MEQVGPPLGAHAEAAKAEEPGEGALLDPTVPAQSLRGMVPAASNAWGDTADAQAAA